MNLTKNSKTERIHYLYRHIRLDTNEVFYVGIGTVLKIAELSKGMKKYYRRAFCKRERKAFWKNVVAKTDYEVEIILESDDYEFIKQKEIEFIALYGRRNLGKGTLVNLTDGGEGCTNMVVSQETREMVSRNMKGKPVNDNCVRMGVEYRKNNPNPFLSLTPEQRIKAVENRKENAIARGYWYTQEAIEKMRMTVVPREKIAEMLENDFTYTDICKLLKTSTVVISKIKEEYNVKDRHDKFILKRSDGKKYKTEAEACRDVGVTKGTINKSIRTRKGNIKGFHWEKIDEYEI